MKKDLPAIVDFFFEVGVLAKTPRSGLQFLGNYHQSVAEHMNRTAYIGYVLALLENDKNVSPDKVMKMCLLHDVAEVRTGDLNWTNQKYVTVDEDQAVADMLTGLPFQDNIKQTIAEYEERKTKEAKLAKDADSLELLLVLKQMLDEGHKKANTWIPSLLKRLLTPAGKTFAKQILKTNSNHWMWANTDEEWWVSRGGGKKKTASSKGE